MDMNTVEVKLLKYTFRFRKLSWREEFGMKFDPKESRLRAILACALVDISGLKINTVEEAKQVLASIPSSIIDRVFVIYKGSQPDYKDFSTLGLYQAPEPRKLAKKITEEMDEREKIMDKVEQEMSSKFGMAELQEAKAREREMLRNSKGRGMTRTTPDDGGKK